MTGRIIFGINNIYTVDTGEMIYQCRIKGKVLQLDGEYYNPLAAGDIVAIEKDPISSSKGLITSLQYRKNSLTRWNRKRKKVQLIASNIDVLFCITTPNDPPFRPRFLDRLLISGKGDYEKVIIMNKSDLPIKDSTLERLSAYEKSGISILRCSALDGTGLPALEKLLSGKMCAFAGQSGVGKSTIINALTGKQGTQGQKTGEISKKYSRGKHTTNYSILIKLSNGGSIIDTPGIRDIFIPPIKPIELSYLLVDFREPSAACNYKGCSHILEEGCMVKQFVAEGKIHPDRYTSYLSLYREMTELPEEIYGSTYI